MRAFFPVVLSAPLQGGKPAQRRLFRPQRRDGRESNYARNIHAPPCFRNFRNSSVFLVSPAEVATTFSLPSTTA